jgi:hypothetical protein
LPVTLGVTAVVPIPSNVERHGDMDVKEFLSELLPEEANLRCRSYCVDKDDIILALVDVGFDAVANPFSAGRTIELIAGLDQIIALVSDMSIDEYLSGRYSTGLEALNDFIDDR